MKQVGKHLGVCAVYFGIMLWGRFFVRGAGEVWQVETLWLLTGGLLGMVMPVVDRLVYVYYVQPQEQLSVHVKALVARRRLVEALRLLSDRRLEQVKLAMNNVLFVVGWVGLAVFMVTSSGSELARGVMLGVGLDLVYDMVTDLKQKDYLVSRLFWPVKRRLGWVEARNVMWGVGVVFIVVSLLSV